jgi:murein DD-endopeptidase MepM/ murein hydrolase activator NlpD
LKACCVLFLFLYATTVEGQWYIPAAYKNVSEIDSVQLTTIGKFGLMRKARPGIPRHCHTGIDILRPDADYNRQPIYPSHAGKIISLRNDGPYAQIIIEHIVQNDTLWTVYEHLVALNEAVGDTVTPLQPIARYFNQAELKKYGRQFDHFHFEIMKKRPLAAEPTKALPGRLYKTWALVCYNQKQLLERMENPVEFLRSKLSVRK